MCRKPNLGRYAHAACLLLNSPAPCASQAPANSRAFYAKAKKNVWQQSVMLTGVGVICALDITFKNLAVLGRSTPLITFTVQVRDHTLLRPKTSWEVLCCR